MNFHSIRTLILVIICNLLALGGYYLLFEHIKAQTQTATTLTSTLDYSQQKNSQLNLLRTAVKDTGDKRQQLAALFLPHDSEVSFIEKIESLAKDSKLKVTTKSVTSTGVNGVTKTLQIQEETDGSWSGTMYFLSQIENLPYNIHIQDVSFMKSGQSWSAIFNFNVSEGV